MQVGHLSTFRATGDEDEELLSSGLAAAAGSWTATAGSELCGALACKSSTQQRHSQSSVHTCARASHMWRTCGMNTPNGLPIRFKADIMPCGLS